MKRISKLLCLFMFVFLLVGCSNYNKSPESVSEEMVKRISSGNYKDMDELLYLEDKTFIDEISFENYLNKKSINIKGNKDYEITKTEENGNYTFVYVRFNNNKGLKIRTIKKDDKWYIDLGNEFDDNLIIKVPVGSTVKLNNTKLDYNKYAKTEQDSLKHNYNYSSLFDVDVYTIPYLLSGEYMLTVENKNVETISTEIKSDSYYFYNTDEDYFADRNSEYLLKMEPTEELKTNIKTYLNTLYTNMLTSINNKGNFNDIEELEDAKKDYNKLLEKKEDIGSYSDTIHSDFRLNNIEITDSYYYGDSAIIVKYNMEYTYHYKFTYTNFMASMGDTFNEDKDVTKTISGILQLQKENDSFEIKSGYNIIPRI